MSIVSVGSFRSLVVRASVARALTGCLALAPSGEGRSDASISCREGLRSLVSVLLLMEISS